MRGFWRAAKNRISDSKGASLGELLVAVLILLMMTTGLTTIMSLAVGQFNESLRSSEAQTLASTLRTVMTDELEGTTEVHIDSDGNVTSFQSKNYNTSNSSLVTFYTPDADSYGKIYVGNSALGLDKSLKILGDGSYSRKLGVKIQSFTYDSDSGCFTVSLDIGVGSTSYGTTTFQVKNMNRLTAGS